MNDEPDGCFILVFLALIVIFLSVVIGYSTSEITKEQYEQVRLLKVSYPTIVEQIMRDGKVTNAEFNSIEDYKANIDRQKVKESLMGK
jgi:hypothetical protein